jgi:hypothetical protein
MTVADADHEDAREAEGFAGVGHGPLVLELGDDDLGVGG